MRRFTLLSFGLGALFALTGCSGAIEIGTDPIAEEDAAPIDGSTDSTTPFDSGGVSDDGIDTSPGDDATPTPDAIGDGPIGFDGGPEVATDTGVDTAPPIDAPPGSCPTTPLAVDPASSLDPLKLGTLPVGHKTYTVPKLNTLTDVKVRVTYPTNSDGTAHAGRHAWVMFHHAVHGPYPGAIYDNYDKTFDHWASHGFIVFSIDGSRIFFPSMSGSSLTWTQQLTVATMMSEAITYFLAEQEKPAHDLACRLDATRVGIAGHSRGGGATMLVPTARTDGAKIKGLINFQGVDPGQLAIPTGYVIPGLDIPGLYLDAALDGDVSYPITAMQYFRSRGLATMITILGSKHTFTLDTPFPTQGGTPPTITPDEHKAVCNQYAVAFLRARVRDATPAATDLDRIAGPGGMTSTASSGDILISWRIPQADKHIAKFDNPAPDPPGKTADGLAIVLEGGMTGVHFETFTASVSGTGAKRVAKEIISLQITWPTTGGALEVPIAPADVTGKKAIVFDYTGPTEETSTGTTPLFIEVTDSAGAKASLPLKDFLGSGWFKRPRRPSIAYAPFAKFTGVDLTKVKSIRFVAKTGATAGTALVDTLRIE